MATALPHPTTFLLLPDSLWAECGSNSAGIAPSRHGKWRNRAIVDELIAREPRNMSFMPGKVQCAALGVLLSVLTTCVSAAQTFALDSTNGLQPHDVKIEAATYRGRKAVQLMPAVPAERSWPPTRTTKVAASSCFETHLFITARLR
jgi:hypothetical protein